MNLIRPIAIAATITLILAGLLCLSGCATIIGGTTQQVNFNQNPKVQP
jgi:hypothetical protein